MILEGRDQERNLVQQNALAFWTHVVRPEGVRIDLREIRINPAPATNNRKPGLVPGFFVPDIWAFNVRFVPESGRSGKMLLKGRL